jgi:putative endonuclease
MLRKSYKYLNRATGRLAEEIAVVELVRKGYQIIEKNWGNKFGEIDIIAKDGETTVFAEVKAKGGEGWGMPEEMVKKGKLQKVRNMATIYLEGKEVPCRIDVVAVVLGRNNKVVRLTHYENVY